MNWANKCIGVLFCCLLVKQLNASESNPREQDVFVIGIKSIEDAEKRLEKALNNIGLIYLYLHCIKDDIKEYENSKLSGAYTEEEARRFGGYFKSSLEDVEREFDKQFLELATIDRLYITEDGKVHFAEQYEEFKKVHTKLTKNRKEFLEYKASKDKEIQQSCLVPIVGSETSH